MSNYNLSTHIEQYNEGQRFKYLFFWGHQPKRHGTIGKTCFSQWWLQDFEQDGIVYKSAEHWMMAEKARLFKDEEILQKTLVANSPAEAKKLGRQVRNFDQTVWTAQRYEIVKKGNILKFAQNEDLKDFLLTTQNRVLVEASPYDAIWGIGMHANDEGIENPNNWKGENLLGFALMEVRDVLLQDSSSS